VVAAGPPNPEAQRARQAVPLAEAGSQGQSAQKYDYQFTQSSTRMPAVKASGYIAEFLHRKVRQVFELSGGMITHLLDSCTGTGASG
jgi:hypothetical protein